MNFTFNITVPAGTPEDNPIKYRMALARGILYEFQILSKPGTNGEVFCYIQDTFGRKIFPRNPDGVYKLWGQTIHGKYPACMYELKGMNMFLDFVGYSPNASYDHVITISFWIVPEDLIPCLKKSTQEEEECKT